MGSCLSKKNTCSSSSSHTATVPEKIKPDTHLEKKKIEEENPVKKEIFIIKHRISHEIDRPRPEEDIEKISPETCKGITFTSTSNNGLTGAAVRTSSCTKEEVDAILIQCGRLSRSSSTGKAAMESGGKKYSGSKRSYDFDNDGKNDVDAEENASKERENRHRHRQSPSHGRRRTPSREREKEQQRSGSRERSGSGGGARRMSRSPAKRSESPNSNIRSNSNSNTNASRPGKMVSVPATITSMGGGVGGEANSGVGVKRIQVKRNVGGGDGGPTSRSTSSPRARSPARMRTSNEQQPTSLSRSNSRKAEHSPYRRNPLSEIDTNIISQAPSIHKPNVENKIISNATNVNHNTKGQLITEENNNKGSDHFVAINVISSGPDILKKPHTITRSRSSRLSRDLEELIINSETPSNSNNSSSYTALLLEDIHNFHQKNNSITSTPTPPPSFSLPPCLTKACSILNAVADLNSTTSSENRLRNPIRSEVKEDQYLESESVAEDDDFTKPSFHKYVTVRRGTIGGEEFEEQESEGSNSFVGSQQQWISPLWEAKSVDSTDRWTSSSSKSVSRGKDLSSEDLMSEMKSVKMSSVARVNYDNQSNGIGRGRVGARGGTSMSATISN